MERGSTLVALVAALVVGLLASTVITGTRLDAVQDRASTLERQAIEADEREVVMAKRLIRLTEQWNQSAETLDLLTEACLAAGHCVGVDDE